jgi:hypothetical protein
MKSTNLLLAFVLLPLELLPADRTLPPSDTLGAGADLAQFRSPPFCLRPMPLWGLNGTITTAQTKAQLTDAREKGGFGGVGVWPVKETQPTYLSEEYFARYGDILSAARSLGMEVILYDDIHFPSGTAGHEFADRYPDDTLHRLHMAETTVQGPADYVQDLPKGQLVGIVAMNTQTWQRMDITASASAGKVSWAAPAGPWNIMIFTCVSMDRAVVDYLDPQAVDKFIALTYERYYQHFPEFFGSVIKRNFFDDVGFFAKPRPWTPAFAEKFQAKYGHSPVTLCPALWHDIGPDTASARVALFSFYAELLAEGYPARVGAWCRAHGMLNQGHPPGNYEPCPIDMHFDIFKFYRHVDIPLLDSIRYYGRGRAGFKLISSAATMYDRPLVAAEEYGAYNERTFDANMLYRTAMELFARGVNRVIPHAMWMDPQNRRIPPLVSPASAKLLPALPDYSQWVARCALMLQAGRPVADIAMLYPIASLQAYYNFNRPSSIRFGFYVPPEADYLRVSDKLSCEVRRDFTFLHPDALERQCALRDATLHLNNAICFQNYRVIIIPGGKVISWVSLARIRDFFRQGGKVVATSRLPDQSAELGHDADVQGAVVEIFGKIPPVTSWTGKPETGLPDPDVAAKPFQINSNPSGGKAYFASEPTSGTLQAILDDALPVADVAFDPNLRVDSGGGFLSYLHKQKEGRDLYFFANSSDDVVDTIVELRGDLPLQIWNPHTGEQAPARVSHAQKHGQPITRLHLQLAPVSTVFAVATNP